MSGGAGGPDDPAGRPGGSGALARLAHPADASAWRDEARRLLASGVPPDRAVWEVEGAPEGGASDLFAGAARDDAAPRDAPAAPDAAAPRVPRAFGALADEVVCHRDPHRFALLYRVLWRLTHGERGLLGNRADADVDALERRAKAVRRDAHKMTAFVRFRRLPDGATRAGEAGDPPVERYAAWFEPEHRICRLTAPFFARRFANMSFAIFTPDESVHWDTRTLGFGPGGSRESVPSVEAMEDLWREYYANIFNPARLKLDAMRAEMPAKYWKNLPEAPLIAGLSAAAGHRAGSMLDAPATAAPRFAVRAGLAARGAAGRDAEPAPEAPAGNGNRVVRGAGSG